MCSWKLITSKSKIKFYKLYLYKIYVVKTKQTKMKKSSEIGYQKIIKKSD